MKDKFYPSPSNFFKIARTIFGVFIFQDFNAAPSLQNDSFDLQTGCRSSLPVLTNGKQSKNGLVDQKYKKKKINNNNNNNNLIMK